MNGRVSRPLLAFALGLVSAVTAEACGDKLVGLGGGVPFAADSPSTLCGTDRALREPRLGIALSR